MNAAELVDAIRQVVRAELRAAGLRRPTPDGLGIWHWNAEADAWVAVDTPDAPVSPPASPSA